MLEFRPLLPIDPPLFSAAFSAQGWDKPTEQYEEYLEFQEAEIYEVIVATFKGEFAGYLFIMWKSGYGPFQEEKIPEICDFNVLMKFWRRGIGTALMDEAERRVKEVSSRVGIGCGLSQDYGAAQVLYVRRGYVPDGKGVMNDGHPVNFGQEITFSDILGLYMIKEL